MRLQPAKSSPPPALGPAAIEKAAKNNKYLFIFFCQEKNDQTSTMFGVFQAAMKKLADRADAIPTQRRGPRGKAARGQVLGARLPPCRWSWPSLPTGPPVLAFPERFDEDQLQQAFVTPCKAKCIRMIQDRGSILPGVQNGKTQFNEAALQAVVAFKAIRISKRSRVMGTHHGGVGRVRNNG